MQNQVPEWQMTGNPAWDNPQPSQADLPAQVQDNSPQDWQQTGNPAWDTPTDVQNAESQTGNQNFNNLCEKFVEEQVYGHSNIFPSAVSAFNYYAQNGVAHQDPSQLKPGDMIYFSPNAGNGNFGHVGLYEGNNKFISATENGVQSQDIGQWMKQTGQQILGFVPAK